MGIFERLPYTNFHELNVNWILKKIKNMQTEIDDLKDRVSALEDQTAQAAEIQSNMRTSLNDRLISLEQTISARDIENDDLHERLLVLEQQTQEIRNNEREAIELDLNQDEVLNNGRL